MKNLNEIKIYFCYLLEENISPPICNRSGEVAVMAKKNKAIMNNNISLWLYIKNMYNYVFNNAYLFPICTNYEICEKQKNLDDECYNNPLKRIIRKPFCIFRQMYQSWGLYKHIVKKENDFCYPIRYIPKN